MGLQGSARPHQTRPLACRFLTSHMIECLCGEDQVLKRLLQGYYCGLNAEHGRMHCHCADSRSLQCLTASATLCMLVHAGVERLPYQHLTPWMNCCSKVNVLQLSKVGQTIFLFIGVAKAFVHRAVRFFRNHDQSFSVYECKRYYLLVLRLTVGERALLKTICYLLHREVNILACRSSGYHVY